MNALVFTSAGRALAILGVLAVLITLLGAMLIHARPLDRPRAGLVTNPKARAGGARAHHLLIGYNLDFPGDWSEAIPFLDLMHDARPWEGAGKGDKYSGLILDEKGWPKSLGNYGAISAIVRTKSSKGFVGHAWVLSYRGEGDLSIEGEVDVLDEQPGRIRFRGRAGNVWITIDSTDPNHTGNYVRDITIVRQDRQKLLNEGKIFNPDLLSYLSPFRSLRFMDWMQSNEAEQQDGGRWKERSKTVQPQWRQQFVDPKRPGAGLTKGGYPVEIMVALANEARAHPHFNMPFKFEDEYVREFAKVVHEKLAPGLVATVEYSNEVWNWQFGQATYARLEAEKLWPGEGTGWLQYMGMRASRMCRIWKGVFARDPRRLRCVIAPQTGWPDVASASLDCPRWVAMGHEPCYKAADAVAITGYFSGCLQKPENTDLVKSWLARGRDYALAQAFRQLDTGGVDGVKNGDRAAAGKDAFSVDGAIAAFREFRGISAERGLGLYVYEGGTHFDHGPDPVLKQFLVDVTRDPRMTRLYLKLFDGFRLAGGSVFNVWGWMGEGSAWANAESLTDLVHPKYRAIVQYSARAGLAP